MIAPNSSSDRLLIVAPKCADCLTDRHTSVSVLPVSRQCEPAMATRRRKSSDTIDFLRAVVSARQPITGKSLASPALSRVAAQKRLERLRREAGGPDLSDDELVAYARAQLTQYASPESRGLFILEKLGDPGARQFAEQAGVQAPVIGDWVELVRSPDDRGWTRSQIAVIEMPKRTIFLRGRAQSWLQEKKAFLRGRWPEAKRDPQLRRHLVPNQLKADLGHFNAAGTDDSPGCVIQVAPVDWLTCYALNSRLESPVTVEGADTSIRDRWGTPSQVVERQAVPGMIVAHIVVETSDRRLLVCQRQTAGMQDEPGTWSLSMEERWTIRGSPQKGETSRRDRHPHDVVSRGLASELGFVGREDDIRILSWGIEPSVLYPGFIAHVKTSLGSWEIAGWRAHASDPNELRFVSSIPASLESLDLLEGDQFAPLGHPELRAPWHRTSKARLFAAMAHTERSRRELLAHLGR
jgi:hypothetical protein